jgi:hypothetical protein
MAMCHLPKEETNMSELLQAHNSTTGRISWWIAAIVIAGILLTAAGGVLALLDPELLVGTGEPMNQAASTYAGYLVSRDLALAVMLLVMLVLQARQVLAGLMILTALTQVIDAVVDATTGRASLLPIILIFALAFLIGAARLLGRLPEREHASGKDNTLP